MRGIYCKIAGWLCSLGAINWGTAVFMNFNMVIYLHNLLGIAYVDQILYGVIALSGVCTLLKSFTGCGMCD